MIGLVIAQGGGFGIALITAIFTSNLPEGTSSSTDLKKGGYTTKKVVFMWIFVLVISALSSVLGYSLFDHASGSRQAIIYSFAAGAITAMIAFTMMPEAHEKGGSIVGLITTIGVFTTL